MILDGSLLAMNSLAEKEGLKGQVQMICLDLRYGIKFGSNLAGQHRQARREGREGRGRHAPARTNPRLL
jgi:adenine-specific DNA-methyltransferase